MENMIKRNCISLISDAHWVRDIYVLLAERVTPQMRQLQGLKKFLQTTAWKINVNRKAIENSFSMNYFPMLGELKALQDKKNGVPTAM